MKNLSIGHTDRYLRFLGTGNDGKVIFAEQSEFYSTEDVFVQAKLKSKHLQEMGLLIKDTIQRYEIYPDKINFAVDSSVSFITTIPIDYSDDSGSINSNILWELSNYFPENYKNYKVNFLKLNGIRDSENIVKKTLVISLHKDDAESVLKIADYAGIKFSIIDIDYLAAVNYFINNHKTNSGQKYKLVVGCKKNKIEVSEICGSRLCDYDYIYIKDSPNREIISDTIRNITEKDVSHDIQDIYLFGEENTIQTVNFISSRFKKYQTVIANPFEISGISDIYKGISPDDLNPNNFIPLAGLSMKG